MTLFLLQEMELSRLYLKTNKDNPWFVLVPRKNRMVELIDLTHEEQSMLMEEITIVSEFLKPIINHTKSMWAHWAISSDNYTCMLLPDMRMIEHGQMPSGVQFHRPYLKKLSFKTLDPILLILWNNLGSFLSFNSLCFS